MHHRKSPTQPTVLDSDGRDCAADGRPRYDPPRIVKRRSVVRATGQTMSSAGLMAGGIPAAAGG